MADKPEVWALMGPTAGGKTAFASALYESGQLKVEMIYENGRPIMRGTMKNNQREGLWEVFYFNGEKSLHSSGEYRNGAWVGPLKD